MIWYIIYSKWCEKCIVPNSSIENGLADFDDIFCEGLSGSLDGLDSQLDPVGPTRGGAHTDILKFTMDIFVYKWLLLVIGEIISWN